MKRALQPPFVKLTERIGGSGGGSSAEMIRRRAWIYAALGCGEIVQGVLRFAWHERGFMGIMPILSIAFGAMFLVFFWRLRSGRAFSVWFRGTR